ncbi:MAG: replicative DNA helicase [Luteimonas sp.]
MSAGGTIEQLAALYGRPRSSHSDAAQLRVPPQSVEAEQAVLGGLMLAPDAYGRIADQLGDQDFYRRDHQLIYRAIRELAEKNRPYDAVTLGEWFESQGLAEQVAGGAYLIELASTTPSAANIAAYAEIVADKSRLRRMIEIGTIMVTDGFVPEGRDTDEIIAAAQSRFVELEPRQRGGLVRAGESLGEWYADLSRRYESGDRMTGMVTPWRELNEATHGLQPGELTLVAARPSMGKSIFGLNLALFAALRAKRVAVFSLEMSRTQCNRRNIASLGQIPHDWLLAPHNDGDYWARVNEALKQIKSAPLFVDDTPSLTVRQLEARARRMHRQQPIDLIVIDHIHDFKIDAKLARFEYGAIAQSIKTLAKEWNVPAVALAQLNRNVTGRSDKRPTLADLRESGELEQKGDLILFLHREDYYDSPEHTTHLQGVVECHIAKGRDIESGRRINLRNAYAQMRLQDWEGPLPRAPEPIQSRQQATAQRWGMAAA